MRTANLWLKSFLLFIEIGSKDDIPEWRTHTVAFIFILVMMKHMMIFDCQPKFTAHVKMVNGIMRNIINQISGDETNIKWCNRVLTEYSKKNKIEEYRKWNAN